MKQDHLLEKCLDNREILDKAQPAIQDRKPVEINLPVVNTDRVVGTITELRFLENKAQKACLKTP